MSLPQQKVEARLDKCLAAERTIILALQGLTNAEVRDVLQRVTATENLRVVSSFAPMGPAVPSAKPKKAGKDAPNPANKDPKVIALKAKLADCQKRIRDSPDKLEDGKLPSNHVLVQERDKYLIEISSQKGSFRGQPSAGQESSSSSSTSSSSTTPATPATAPPKAGAKKTAKK